MLILKVQWLHLLKKPLPSHEEGISWLAHKILKAELRDINMQVVA